MRTIFSPLLFPLLFRSFPLIFCSFPRLFRSFSRSFPLLLAPFLPISALVSPLFRSFFAHLTLIWGGKQRQALQEWRHVGIGQEARPGCALGQGSSAHPGGRGAYFIYITSFHYTFISHLNSFFIHPFVHSFIICLIICSFICY